LPGAERLFTASIDAVRYQHVVHRASCASGTLMTISVETRLSRNPSLVHTELDGHTMMMSLEAAKYFSLNPMGSRIWQLIEHPVAAGDVVVALGQEFEVDAEQCRTQTFGFLERLVANNLAIVDMAR
jgi:hypothetical protein